MAGMRVGLAGGMIKFSDGGDVELLTQSGRLDPEVAESRGLIGHAVWLYHFPGWRKLGKDGAF